MKKVFKTLGIIAVIAIIGLGMVACKPDPCKNGHTFPDWTDPTCTVDGNSERTCVNCTQKDTRTTGFTAGHDHVESLICKRDGCNHQYSIGDTGPAGGIIFYVASNGFTMTDDGTIAHYLEAAPTNTAIEFRWSTITWEEYKASEYDSSIFIDIPGTGIAIGTGRKNTALILELDAAAPAALRCKNYFITGFESYNDWFLPSKDELSQLRLRRAIFGIPNNFIMWSSSQDNQYDDSYGSAWSQSFGNGEQRDQDKVSEHYVHAIRAF